MRSFAIIFAASLFILFPYFIYDVGSESMTYQQYLRCFATQFWQGDLYPRWCFHTNADQGSPIFIFYFPLAYWLGSLFYPLVWAGLSLKHLYVVLLWLVTLASGFTSYAWLRTFSLRKAALAGSVVYMLAPYHAELVLYRSSYSEALLLAMLPLLFIHARRLATGAPRAWPVVAMLYALCVLAHVSDALIAGIGVGIYALLAAPRERYVRTVALTAGALLTGIAMTSFYWGVAAYYQQFIISGDRIWQGVPLANRYPDIFNIAQDSRIDAMTPLLYLACTASCILFVGLTGMYLAAGRAGRDKEIVRWILLYIAAFLLFAPLLKPVWDRLPYVQGVFLPWRMQLLWIPALSALAAGLVTLRLNATPPRKWIGDSLAVLLLLMLVSFSLIRVIQPEQDHTAYYETVPMNQYPFHPVWVDNRYNTTRSVYDHWKRGRRFDASPKNTHVDIGEWGPDRITLEVMTPRAATIVLYHRYFPTWVLEGLPQKNLSPHAPEGGMAISVPEGKHTLTLRHDVSAGARWLAFLPWLCGGLWVLMWLMSQPRFGRKL